MMGTAFALWSKTLTIQGTVDTGVVDVEVISVSSDDPPGAIDPGKDKDVGCTYVSLIDSQTINVTIVNAYPCYYVYVHFSVHNNGTIPVILQDIIVTAPPEITVNAWDSIGEQIDPCENADNSMYIHLEQDATQNATYTFTVQFHYVQWNEAGI
ncbi:hypothetical protein DRN86_04050 [Candidatus Geothermarchaeota archaeon]|nr:MAG: hypothetical protein DRN86_04050 [Candidatus Geothermarchaeota archaeon]